VRQLVAATGHDVEHVIDLDHLDHLPHRDHSAAAAGYEHDDQHVSGAHHDPAQDDDLIDACEHIDDLDDLDDLGDLASRHDHDDHGDPPGAIGVPGPVGQLRHP
jgi:hypothetical protein